jgi:lambda repressor-like predicted transcriptional regulator
MTAMTKEKLTARLKTAVAKAGGLTEFAYHNGISIYTLRACLYSRLKPSKKIARALGYEPVTVYQPVKLVKVPKRKK